MRQLFFILSLVCLTFSGIAQKKIQAYFSYSIFNVPGGDPYVETYLSVNGETVKYETNDKGKLQAEIEVTYLFKQNDEIKQFDKYKLLSPEIADAKSSKLNFLDQQRIAVPAGSYQLEINIRDVNNKGNGFSGSQKIDLHFDKSRVQWSSIELVESYKPAAENNNFTKSGIEIIPNVTDYYPDHVKSLKFYSEVYHADSILKGEKFLIKYYIAKYETNQPMSQYIGFIRQNPSPVGIVLREFNIEKLASGNYLLVIEARDRSNELLSFTSTFFQRSNIAADTAQLDLEDVITDLTFVEQYTNLDTLRDHIRSLRPISDRGEESFIDQQTKRKAQPELVVLQKFLYHFWAKRYPLQPEVEWNKYQAEVKKVNANFSTSIQDGFDTDRGRIYLKYGPPNNRIEVPSEPDSYPYEIWHYFKIANQTNGKFVFYNEDLITNDFTMLHSTVFGEIQNPRWEMILKQRNTPMRDLDQMDPGDSYGSRARYYFDNPR